MKNVNVMYRVFFNIKIYLKNMIKMFCKYNFDSMSLKNFMYNIKEEKGENIVIWLKSNLLKGKYI